MLYDAYCTLIYRLIIRIVQDPGAAEELVQETFLKLWKRAYLLDDTARSIAPWLMTIARNHAVDFLRSSYNQLPAHSTSLTAVEHSAIFSSWDPEITNSAHALQLEEALGSLNANQRQLIELAYYEGLSHAEMAKRLDQPLGTVKSRMRSALSVLRAKLQEKGK